MNCIKCGTVINPLRLKALPGTKVCVICSTTAPIYARPIISGKTNYSELEIIKDPVAAEEMRRWDRKGRTGYGSSLYRVRS